MNYHENYIQSALIEFRRYKTLGDKNFDQLKEKDIHWVYNSTDNSIALIVKHMVGNMLSRWTKFLTEDGEKTWRNRETEFENAFGYYTEMIQAWENGWQCLFNASNTIYADNSNSKIYNRNEPHTVIEAVNRQLAQYANHVGQIVFIGKILTGDSWVLLSILKGGSSTFNAKLFERP
jgi:hypothetical protein